MIKMVLMKINIGLLSYFECRFFMLGGREGLKSRMSHIPSGHSLPMPVIHLWHNFNVGQHLFLWNNPFYSNDLSIFMHETFCSLTKLYNSLKKKLFTFSTMVTSEALPRVPCPTWSMPKAQVIQY